MGIPFPFLLRLSIIPTGDNRLYPWMIGFNSIATLSGGVLSMLIAMTLGYRFIMIAGILSYALLMGLISRFRLTP